MSTPSTTISVCNVDFTNDYQHVVYFDNVSEQNLYFGNRILKQWYDYTYVRKNWTLKVNATITQAEKWNYLFFYQNEKKYYYFITNVRYISDETVELSLEMDVMQTYMFVYNLRPSFVEREHSATDNIADNTVDEGLELGAYTNAGKSTPELFTKDLSLFMMTTEKLVSYENVKPEKIDGIISGCQIYQFDIDKDSGLNAVNTMFNLLNNNGKTDIVLSMWMFPKELVETSQYYYEENSGVAGLNVVSGNKVEGVDYYIPNRPSDFSGYTPKNQKLLTFPFNFIYATDNKGNHATYRYERFENNAFEFSIEGSAFPDGGVKITPKNYNGIGYNYDESITITGLPTCAWASDTYKIWLAQNQNQHAVSNAIATGSVLAGGVMTAIGVATANPILAGSGVATMVGGFSNVASHVAQVKDMQAQPDQARGASSGTLNASLNLFIDFYRRQITKERAQIIDEYFTMYGYKTLRVKIPNRNVRTKFTYTKTVNACVTGQLCQEDIRKIQSIYDKGVTFWNKDATIGDYTVSNDVL